MDKFYTVKELANLLALSDQSIRLYLRQGKLKSYKFGVEHRISQEQFQEFLENHKVKTTKEVV